MRAKKGVKRAAVIEVVQIGRVEGNNYRIEYKLLHRGPKPRLWSVVGARDELDAFMQFKTILEKRGYRV